MNRIALGTAQFGQAYGVANLSGRVPADAIAAMLKLAGDQGVDTLDTAIAYGDSEACLGAAGVSSWRVVTKVPPLPEDIEDVNAWIEAQVQHSLQRLKLRRLDGLLLHRSADILGPRGAKLRAALAALQCRDWVGLTGISIYDPGELDAVWPVWQPQLVQAPCNVLDRRLIRSGWLSRLSQSGVRVHARSVFLQGLLLMPSTQRPEWFGRWRALLDRWLAWCAAQSVSPLCAALAFSFGQSGIERVVVGVDSIAQLREILTTEIGAVPMPPMDLFSDDRDLVEPSRWRLA
jgi:aryl-alcohol dehydrogenase-like predicted oxidoreductase